VRLHLRNSISLRLEQPVQPSIPNWLGKSNADQTTNQKNGKAMEHIFTGFNLIGAFALLALAVGCASMQTQNKENLLIAAGFRTIITLTSL
jgi:hypothetical protein